MLTAGLIIEAISHLSLRRFPQRSRPAPPQTSPEKQAKSQRPQGRAPGHCRHREPGAGYCMLGVGLVRALVLMLGVGLVRTPQNMSGAHCTQDIGIQFHYWVGGDPSDILVGL